MIKNRCVYVLMLLYFVMLATSGHVQAACEEGYSLYKSQVHPYMVKNCASCHGDKADPDLKAPPHSSENTSNAYNLTRKYIKFGDKWLRSKLIRMAQNGHCLEEGGKEGCGAKPGEFAPVIEEWVLAENKCGTTSESVENEMKNSAAATSPAAKLSYDEKFNIALKREILANQKSPYGSSTVSGVKFAQLAMDDGNVCALLTTGELACWGRNIKISEAKSSGKENTQVAYIVPFKEKVVSVAAFDGNMCAVFESKRAKCWGRPTASGSMNYYYSEEIAFLSQSRPYLNITDVKEISVSYSSACALFTNGKAQCWGDNSYGELGVGISDELFELYKDNYENDTYRPHGMKFKPYVKAREKIVKIRAGVEHTCALYETNEVECWGHPNYAKLEAPKISEPESISKKSKVTRGQYKHLLYRQFFSPRKTSVPLPEPALDMLLPIILLAFF